MRALPHVRPPEPCCLAAHTHRKVPQTQPWMGEVLDILHKYMSEGMHWSALLVGEYLYNKDRSDGVLLVVVEAMFALGFHERCIEVIEKTPEIQKFYDVHKIYLRCVGTSPHRRPKKLADTETAAPTPGGRGACCGARCPQMGTNSVLELYRSGCSEDPKKHLVDAFHADTRNFEALFLLKNSGIVSPDEMSSLLALVKKKEVLECYSKILFGKSYLKTVFSPTSFLKIAREYYISRNDMDLFSLAVYVTRFYGRCEYAYFVIGMYYLLKCNYEEAKKCFYRSLKAKQSFGHGWVGLGIAYSGLKECISALECFTNAYQQMTCSGLPALYLGFEYHKMNNPEQAELWYKRSLQVERNSAIVQKYSAFLISCERYGEALELLAYKNSAGEDRYLRNGSTMGLLRCFSCLFIGKLHDAQGYLSGCDRDWRYFVTSGFIKHVQNKVPEAAYDYHQALIRAGQNSVVEDLLSHSVDNMAKSEENTAFKYASDLFDTLDLKSTAINFI